MQTSRRMTNAVANTEHSRLRTAVEGCVWLLLAAVMLETWLLAGAVVPCRVAGGSMAETLLGVHREVVCADCGRRFTYGAEAPELARRAVCPNCGYTADDLQTLPDLDGDRLLIDRAAFSLRPPRRWEIAALRHPRHADQILVKRVVGLPGESIEIRDGDVFADGQIQRKNLAEQHALAILVHDADFRPMLDPAIPSRWRPERRDSRWNSAAEGFSHPAAPENEPIDWLVYHHTRRGAGIKSPVTDVCGYNQSQPRREEDVHAMADLLLSFRLAILSGRGQFRVRADDGGKPFEIRLHFDENRRGQFSYELYRGGESIPRQVGGWDVAVGEHLVEASLIDHQFLLAFDGETVVTWPYERPSQPSPTPLAIGLQGLEATVRSLRVYRDVYYTQPVGIRAATSKGTVPFSLTRKLGQSPGQVRLADDEYFVLGDNSPISDDSRTWPDRGGVAAKLLIGKPLAAIPSIEINPWRGWRFQVPNPAGIRYIQ
jgi:signal peptidase I